MIKTGSQSQLKVLVFGASLRAESLNQKLAVLAARIAERSGATGDHTSMRDFDVASYDGDAEKAQGIRRRTSFSARLPVTWTGYLDWHLLS
jgi:NAD(P)H-dependent FMN reductase